MKGNIFTALANEYEFSYADHDRIKAIMSERYNVGPYRVYNWADEGGDPEVAYSGYLLEKAQNEFETAGWVEGFEHSEQLWVLEQISADENDYTEIAKRSIPPINEETDAILYQVEKHFGGKYTTHELESGATLKLRIADHSGKWANNMGYKCLSIVIANDNVTSHFRTNSPDGISNEHFYNDSYTAEQIISEIYQLMADAGVIEETTD